MQISLMDNLPSNKIGFKLLLRLDGAKILLILLKCKCFLNYFHEMGKIVTKMLYSMYK